MSISAEVRPSRGYGYFVAGGILLLVAVAGILVYITALPDQLPLDGATIGLVRGGTVVASAIAGGAGALLLALGGVKRVSAAHRGLPEDPAPED